VSFLVRRPVAGAATIAGKALAGLFFLIGKRRGSPRKALHPRGEVRHGLVRRQGCSWRTGVTWLDDGGSDRLLLRFSRSVGLPKPFPDVLGLARRIPLKENRHGDLLLATTGAGGLGRFLLRPARHRGAVYNCLIPYRTPTGPLLVAALPIDDDGLQFELVCAPLRGAWSSSAGSTSYQHLTTVQTPQCPLIQSSMWCRVWKATPGPRNCGGSPTPHPDELGGPVPSSARAG
jgi:hypothetical protein